MTKRQSCSQKIVVTVFNHIVQDVLGTEIYDKTVNVLKMRKSRTCGMLFGSN